MNKFESRSRLETKLKNIRENLPEPEEDSHHDYQDYDYTSIGKYRQLLRPELDEHGVSLSTNVENVEKQGKYHVVNVSITAYDMDTGARKNLGSAATRSEISSQTPVRAARSTAAKSVIIDTFWPQQRHSEDSETKRTNSTDNDNNNNSNNNHDEEDLEDNYENLTDKTGTITDGQESAIYAIAQKKDGDKDENIEALVSVLEVEELTDISKRMAAKVIDRLEEKGFPKKKLTNDKGTTEQGRIELLEKLEDVAKNNGVKYSKLLEIMKNEGVNKGKPTQEQYETIKSKISE